MRACELKTSPGLALGLIPFILLENINDYSWYIGYTSDLKRRLKQHLSGRGSRTTRQKDGWKLVYCEGYKNKHDAESREKFLKSGSGRKFLKKQLRNYLQKYS